MNNTAECITKVEIPIAQTEASGIRKVQAGFNASSTQLVVNPIEREMLLIQKLVNEVSEVPNHSDLMEFINNL